MISLTIPEYMFVWWIYLRYHLITIFIEDKLSCIHMDNIQWKLITANLILNLERRILPDSFEGPLSVGFCKIFLARSVGPIAIKLHLHLQACWNYRTVQLHMTFYRPNAIIKRILKLVSGSGQWVHFEFDMWHRVTSQRFDRKVPIHRQAQTDRFLLI